MTVEVYAFHKKGLKPPIKKVMSYGEFSELKSKDYYYRAYALGFNTTILND
jgi:hypothetical protein